jgi:hypothetical protein
MRVRKTGVVKSTSKAPAAHKRVQLILNSDTVRSEYQDALKFAVWFNTRRCKSGGGILTANVAKTVEKASRDYILAGQARSQTPDELKRKVLSAGRKSRNQTVWTPDASLEEKHSLMAGARLKVKA